jgi:hypothetical protein
VNEATMNAALFDMTIPAALWDDLKAEHLLPAEAPVPS